MQLDRSTNLIEITQYLLKNNSFQNNQGCISSVLPPVNGGKMNYWAIIRDAKTNIPKILLKKQIGYKTSQDGEIHDICTIKNTVNEKIKLYECEHNKKYNIIAKLIPISSDANNNLFNLKYHPWKELFATFLGHSMIINACSPHFILYYGYFRCNHSDKSMFKNVNIIKRLNNKAITTELKKHIVDIGIGINKLDISEETKNIIVPKYEALEKDINRINKSDYAAGVLTIILEKGNSDLSHYIDTKSFISTKEIEIITFQILQALMCLHEYTQFVHLDLHLYNILVKNIPTKYKNKKLYKKYNIHDNLFYVENNEIDICLIDFGRSEHLPSLSIDELANEAKSQHNFLFDTTKTATYYNNIKYNLTKNKKFYREYFKSFDVYRVFSELYASCKDQIDPDADKLLKGIIRDSKQDFLVNFATYIPNSKISKKHEYQGHPYTLIKKFYIEFGTFSQDLEAIEPEIWYNDYYSTKYKDYEITNDNIKDFHNTVLYPKLNANRKKNQEIKNVEIKNIQQPELSDA